MVGVVGEAEEAVVEVVVAVEGAAVEVEVEVAVVEEAAGSEAAEVAVRGALGEAGKVVGDPGEVVEE